MAFGKKTYTDRELIEAIRRGGLAREKALLFLYKRYVAFVYKLQKRYSLSIEDAKDAYSDAIIVAGEQISKNMFRGESQISSYLYRIFSNKCVDLIRKKANPPTHTLETVSTLSDREKSMQDLLEVRDEVRELEHVLDQMGPSCKQILLDWAYFGYSMEEIAQRAGLKNAESAMSQKYKCFKKLKQLLKKVQKPISS